MKKIAKKMALVEIVLVFSLCLGVLLGVSGLALGQSLVDKGKEESSPCTKTYVPANELPSEWVWRAKTVNFDHMYRKAR